jgi:hypothetical protein
MKSKFVAGLKINGIHAKFERWLARSGYCGVHESYPAAIHSETLTNEFLTEYPGITTEDELIEITAKIGYISDYAEEDHLYDEDDYHDD